MPSSVTSLLLLDTDQTSGIVAAVLGANPTATTYLLDCVPGTDSEDCGLYRESVTIGPYASPTPPPGAPHTGAYDVHAEQADFTLSLHCEMSGTVARECTTVNIGGNNDGTATAKITSPDPSDFSFAYVPVTITSGLEKLTQATGSSDNSAATTTTGSAQETGDSNSDDKDSAASGLSLSTVTAAVLFAGLFASML